ncbi:MAG: M48 family metalloprotease [Lachnospiraceae bacterium]|nr:M48 family metalloprotease [Lachnospiraceae bacterium]
MGRLQKTFILLLILISAAGAAAQNNVSDALSRMERSINISQEEFSMQDIYFLGRAAAAHLLNHFTLYTERPDQTNYLNLICNTLAINSPMPNWYNGYYVMILNTPVINAFATPGGHIFLTRGILDLLTSEDMLAAIIAHEMAHIQLRHGIAVIQHSNLVQNLNQERRRISQSLGNETQQQLFTAAVDEFIQSLFSGGYSQLQEFEADSTAFSLLVSAGYNPASLVELFGLLGKLQGNQAGSLNSTHPLPAQRIGNLQGMMNAYRGADTGGVRRERFLRGMGR